MPIMSQVNYYKNKPILHEIMMTFDNSEYASVHHTRKMSLHYLHTELIQLIRVLLFRSQS